MKRRTFLAGLAASVVAPVAAPVAPAAAPAAEYAAASVAIDAGVWRLVAQHAVTIGHVAASAAQADSRAGSP